MALVAGTVSIHPTTGAVSGSGYALTLYAGPTFNVPDKVAELEPLRLLRFQNELANVSFWEPRRSEEIAKFTELIAGIPAWVVATKAEMIAARVAEAAACVAKAEALIDLIKSTTVTVACPPGGGTVVGVVT